MKQHSHYFLNKEHEQSDYFSFSDECLGKQYVLQSCSDVFSKSNIDYGTKILLAAIDKYLELSGDVLDLGCGYGIIAIVLNRLFDDINLTMVDVNDTALELSQKNTKAYSVSADILHSDLYSSLNKKFDHIVTNPPIKAGKQNLFNVITFAPEYLKRGGDITLVIKKKHGMESFKNHMKQTFGNVEVLKRDSGYYILHSVKQ